MASSTSREPTFGHQRPDRDIARQAGAKPVADVMLAATVIAMGLFAGLFFTFTTAVMPGLTAADDRTMVDGMQRMIENPVFPLTFFLAGALNVIALVQARRAGSTRLVGWIVAGFAFYMVVFIVTSVVHFPLNDELMQAGDPDRIENLTAVHDDFVSPWVAWDLVRTLASAAAFACLTWALILLGRLPSGNR